jgi:LPXTG-motif cell wall-anchored protein
MSYVERTYCGGTIIGLIWADTSDVAGSIAVITNIIGVGGIVLLLIALAVVTRRRRQKLAA